MYCKRPSVNTLQRHLMFQIYCTDKETTRRNHRQRKEYEILTNSRCKHHVCKNRRSMHQAFRNQNWPLILYCSEDDTKSDEQ